MLDQLAEVKYFECRRRINATQENHYRKMRNLWIVTAFNSDIRQKEIASATGLSESTIKHIIAQQKKENEK
ncbi:MAG: hypothetical protein WC856_28635 [Methylococcaceae bacterium]|jgi:DNA-binding transcriptional regulator LsrR (DeoR family)